MICVCLAVWSTLQAWPDTMAQGGRLRFRHFTTDDKLPSDCVRDIAQDSQGFMWFATDGGVARFDGYNFKLYPIDGNGIDIRGNYPASLHSDATGLWLGTDIGLYRYDTGTDRFVKVEMTYEKGNRVGGRISQIAGDKDGNLWVGLNGLGLARFKPGAEPMPTVHLYSFPGAGWQVGKIYVDSRNDVWVTSRPGRGGLYRLDKHENTFRPYALHHEGTEIEVYAMAIAEDSRHAMWLGEWNGEILQFNPQTAMVTKRVSEIGANHIHSMLARDDGTLVIGSDEGMHIYDTLTGSARGYKQDELDANSLSDQFVYPLVSDAEGGLWIGTFYGGVNYLPPILKEFEPFKTSRYANSVEGKIISAFAEDAHGNIFIASDDGGLSRYDITTGKFTNIPLSSGGHDNLHALMIDGNDLWVGSYADGVYVYDILTGKVKKIGTEKDNSSYAMLRDSAGNLWVATDKWLNRYDRAKDRLEIVRELNAQIIDIEEDSEGCLWICTQGDGLYRHNPATDDWRNYRNNQSEGSLPHNHVFAVAPDEKGRIWAATEGGLGKYDADSEVFVKDMRVAGQGSVMSIVEYQDALWLATHGGLVKYVPGVSIDVFTRLDGLSSTQFMPNAMLKSSNGKIYVGTRDGFTSFFPYRIRPNEMVAPVVITEVQVDNVRQMPFSDRLTDNPNLGGVLRLLPGDYGMTIDFASLSYVNPERNQYKYRLDGFDRDWVEAGSDNRANYTNLAPGAYTFRVTGSNGDNIWTEAETTLRVDVLAPWYLRWPMKVLYLLLICAAVLGVVLWYVKNSDKKYREELNRINASKELDVYHAKMSFFTMVAHEIRTPVSLIIGPLEKLMRDTHGLKADQISDLNIIERNSQRLLFLVNQLLDFKKVEKSGVNATFAPCKVSQLLRSVAERFRPSLEQNGVSLDIICDVDDDFTADIDAELITKLISNLMNNARKFTNDKVSITLSVEPDGDKFRISVADNGPGLNRDEQRKIFRPFYQVPTKDNESKGGTGLGLSIVQSAVDAHGGTITVHSDVGKGATFTAIMPVHQREVIAPDANGVQKEADMKASTHDAAAQPASMLVVEDNEELCNFIAGSFRDTYRVSTAHDGEEAMKLLRAHEFSLIVSDWMMPRKDGVELCREVRADKNLSHIPFVLLTAKTDKISKVEGFNCGADAYVEKPFSLQVLQAQISNMLKVRQMLRDKYSQKPLEPISTVALTPVDNNFLTELTEFIEANFSNPDLDVDVLATKMDMSRSTLYAKIRSLVDLTPNDLIRVTRLKNAAQLLSSGKYRVNEVCFMVGFNGSSYFSKCFQKQFGMSPSEFVAKS